MKKRADLPLPQSVSGVGTKNLIPGEDAAAYDLLWGELVNHYKPKSILEQMEVKHLQDALWEINRLIRIKPQVLNSDLKNALQALLESMLDDGIVDLDSEYQNKAASQAAAYFNGIDEKKKIEAEMARFNLNVDSITAKAFVLNIDALDAIERQIQIATVRAYAIRDRLERDRDRNYFPRRHSRRVAHDSNAVD
jgi:hypothetical protein